MRRTLFALLLLSFIGLAAAPAQAAGAWPSLSAQLSQDRIQPGSALERLILANQDFSLLRADEVKDRNPLPPWLRVVWRKAHPEITYSPKDPTGGYPLVLKEVYEWMLAHQDLKPGKREPSRLATRVISESGEQRISGLQTSRRSESDIRVDPFDTTKIISASNNIGGSGMQAVYFSTNSGASWGQTTLPLVTGDAFHSDPTVDWTSDGTAWSTTIGINSAGTILHMRSYKSTNNGSTWAFDATFSGSQSSTDKQMIWADHSAASAFKDNLYAIWHNGAPVFMNRRTGPTGSWQTAIQVSGSETTGTGIGADVKTNSGGDLFGSWPDTGSQRIFVVKSTNGGVSYGTPTQIASTFGSFNITIPAMASRKPLIYVSLGTNKSGTKNNVYASWMDLSGDAGCTIPSNEPGTNVASTCKTRIFFSRSTNGGTSWSTPVKINNQASKNDQFNQWLTVDDTTGGISIIYYDTVNDAGRKKTDVWYQSSTDDGATWSAPFKVTTAQTDETVSGSDSGNQYGDYNALSGRAGTFFPTWTDRRNNANEEIWTAAIADSGASCTPPGAPTGVSATAAGQTQINLSWSAVSGATEYHVLRSTTSGGPYTQVGSVTTTSFSDTGLTCNTAYFYVVRAATSPTCESANSVEVTAT
ncbi:MAG TPA: hypothetical protein VOA87_16145, partial [Thermoanaerobaculia bacterium]|nr:hypothetical protein [Thermoanaerobaculia bacterium]